MIRLALALTLLLVSGCAGPGMPTSLRGQDSVTVERDRRECERRVQTDPAISSATTPTGGQAIYWSLGGPASAVGQEMSLQRHAAFKACMEPRGYTIGGP